MNPIELSEATKAAVKSVSANFMLDGATYARGAELGFDGADFYVGGRGGVLGSVTGEVVAAAFGFFEPTMVSLAWGRARDVMARFDAAGEFAACGHAWARSHLGDVAEGVLHQVADAGAKVVAAASPAGVPVFAAWRTMPVPQDAPARALHVMNALRELRNGYHIGAVSVSGLLPVEAMAVASPAMAALFGWSELPPVDDEKRQLWAEAETLTDIAFARALAVLTDREAGQFTDACRSLMQAY